jgi:hypothetical protein
LISSGALAGAIAVRPSAASSAVSSAVVGGTAGGAGAGGMTVPAPPVPCSAEAGAANAASVETTIAIARTHERPHGEVRKLNSSFGCRRG